jgi:enoyl-CoA hydratase/carnithine racemase
MPEVLLERPIEAVAVVRLNRPEALNSLNSRVRELINEHFLKLNEDESVRAVILTGNEKAFAAGGDLKEMSTMRPADHLKRRSHRAWAALEDCPKPVIAAINGWALGGGLEVAMHADILIAGESAKLGQPEIKVGIMPGAGGTQRLTRVVGKFVAMKMCLLGEPITAREALQWGLVSEVVPDDQVLPRALEMAQKIAQMPPLAVMSVKDVLLAGLDASLDTGLMLERKAFDVLFDTEDQKEGMRAFIEKRPPSYKGS